MRNDSLLSLSFLYHPAKNFKVSNSIWGELFLVFGVSNSPSFAYDIDEKTRWVVTLSRGKVNFKREIVMCPDLYLPRQKIN